ncbi:MAG: flagellar protein [Lachnospiraceae bacterium]|nr:flagellar protein [Lachnospiraceae bacterium]
MNRIGNGIGSIQQLTDQYLGSTPLLKTKSAQSFQDALQKAAFANEEVKFSKHAMQRLSDRDINLDATQSERLADGFRKADEKGIKDSLVLMDKLAFIVNVPSHTVVTAMDETESKEKAFTNIDGAVIV